MKYLITAAIMLMLLSCNQSATTTPSPEVEALKKQLATAQQKLKASETDATDFIHTVFFWMNEGVTDEQKSDFEKNGLEELTKITSIHKGYYGPPAATSRGVIDNSYDFALVCHFKKPEDQDKYQVDPIHLEFIEKYEDLWKKVLVYDNLVSNN